MRNPAESTEIDVTPTGAMSNVAIEPKLTEILASEAVRLARLATSLHLAEQARLMAVAELDDDAKVSAPAQPSPAASETVS